jgi:hypothetical protein
MEHADASLPMEIGSGKIDENELASTHRPLRALDLEPDIERESHGPTLHGPYVLDDRAQT